LLAYESKGLLIGEGARAAVIAGIERIASEKPGIDRINELLTMHLGPRDVLLTLSLDFDDGLTASRVETVISELETSIKSSFPEVTRVFIEAQSWRAHRQNEKSSRWGEDPETLRAENRE
jgi:divalent metal cation (Fe/Co/Zn/Cd) transporter